MMSEHEITETINSIPLDVFNAINDIIKKNINHISGVHNAGNTRLWCHGGVLDSRCDNNGVHSTTLGMQVSDMTR